MSQGHFRVALLRLSLIVKFELKYSSFENDFLEVKIPKFIYDFLFLK